jgi:hypothetical protein
LRGFVHPPERILNGPVTARGYSDETIVMDDLDEDGKRKGWKSE